MGSPSSCISGKLFYDTEFEAGVAAAYRRSASGHESIMAYKCRQCPGYHIGHDLGTKYRFTKITCRVCHGKIKSEEFQKHRQEVHRVFA